MSLYLMRNPFHLVEIVDVAQFESYGLVITFSDGTQANYVVEELLKLRPHRAPAQVSMESPVEA
jgi:hypothetical protein